MNNTISHTHYYLKIISKSDQSTLTISLKATTLVVINVRFAWNYIFAVFFFIFESLLSYLCIWFSKQKHQKHVIVFQLGTELLTDSMYVRYMYRYLPGWPVRFIGFQNIVNFWIELTFNFTKVFLFASRCSDIRTECSSYF